MRRLIPVALFILLCAFAALKVEALPQASTPTFSPVAGPYSSAQTVTISATTGDSAHSATTGKQAHSATPATGTTVVFAIEGTHN